MKPTTKATEYEMVELLRKRYCADSGNGPSAVLLPQVRNAAGFDATRTADALVMQLWPSRGLHLEGFEIKCSRSDLVKELKTPEKAESIAKFCERWWLVLSEPFHKDDEIPPGWGLLVRQGSRLVCVTQAPVRKDVPKVLPKTFLAAILRQADRELNRPTEEALGAKYAEGVKAGERNAQYKLEQYAQLQDQVKLFEEQTGLQISHSHQLAGIIDAVNLVRGGNWRSGLVDRLRQLSASAARVAEEVDGALKHDVLQSGDGGESP